MACATTHYDNVQYQSFVSLDNILLVRAHALSYVMSPFLGLAMRGYAALSGLAPPRPLLIYQTSLNDNRQDDLMAIFLSPHSLPRHNA